jgi:hypothetical protein
MEAKPNQVDPFDLKIDLLVYLNADRNLDEVKGQSTVDCSDCRAYKSYELVEVFGDGVRLKDWTYCATNDAPSGDHECIRPECEIVARVEAMPDCAQ